MRRPGNERRTRMIGGSIFAFLYVLIVPQAFLKINIYDNIVTYFCDFVTFL